MPTLLELQRAVRRALVWRGDGGACAHIHADSIAPADRLGVYRNTFNGNLTKALSLAYPAVHHLVGAEFFEGTAEAFIAAEPPRSAWLDEYGAGFPEFLARFPPAASVRYLPDVGRVEWAVNKALHAPDVRPVEIDQVAHVPMADRERIRFAPHPSLTLLRTSFPADAIWRSVLADDDAALAAIDLGSGPVCLLVERAANGVDVHRMSDAAWRFSVDLCAGRPLQATLNSAPDIDASVLLAEHLASGRFIGFELASVSPPAKPSEAAP